MGFEFTNEPPATSNTASAFRPLPSLRSTVGIARNVRGPVVNTESAPPTAPRLPLPFGACPGQTTVSLTAPSQETIDGNNDAISFFRNLKSPSKREVSYQDEEVDNEPLSKFKCSCLRTAAAASTPLYQPSTAAHTIRQGYLWRLNTITASKPRPFRLLDLPGELRNRIYRAAISPGHISLRSCGKHHLSVGVSPVLATGILATSRQLAHETKGLVFESTFIVDVYLESGVRPVIDPHQLPWHLLDKIQHIVLVLDFTRVWDSSPSRNDWRPLQAMTALKSLRLCAIQMWPPAALYRPNRTLQHHQVATIQTIFECIPAKCAVEYGWRHEVEEEHVKEMHRRIIPQSGPRKESFSHAEIADPAELAAAASKIDNDTRKGWKNGSKVDFRFVGTG